MNSINEIKTKLQTIRMQRMAFELEQVYKETNAKNLSSLDFLERLVDMEIEDRRKRSVEYRISEAKLPKLPTID